MWPFSSYSPIQWAPRNLFEGEAEQSPEEMRLMYYLAEAQGNPQAAVCDAILNVNRQV
jgi:nucleoporin NUP42